MMITLKPNCVIDQMWDGEIRITLKEGLSDEIVSYIASNKIDYYVIEDGDWSCFDQLIPFKEKLRSVNVSTQNLPWEILSEFSYIEKLIIGGTFKNCVIDFSKLTKLKNLKTYWNGGYERVLRNVKSLKTLSIVNYAGEDLSLLGNMKNLEYLELINSRKLESLRGIRNFKKLKYFAADGCSKLSDLSDIDELGKIEFLSITKCKKENDYSVLGGLTSLKELLLGGELIDIYWVKKLTNLKSLRMDCKIEDGNLDFLYEMPMLQLVLFKDRKNFSVKLKDIHNDLAKKGFNQEELRMEGMQFSDGYK